MNPLKIFIYTRMIVLFILIFFSSSCDKNTNLTKHNSIKPVIFSNIVLAGYPAYDKTDEEIGKLKLFGKNDILQTSFFRDTLLQNVFSINLPSSKLVYINGIKENPVYYLAIERDYRIIGFVIGIVKNTNDKPKIIAGYRDYSKYNLSTFTGNIIDWDLNDNYLVGEIKFIHKKMLSWYCATINKKNKTIIGLSTITNRAVLCDSNKDGDIGFGECYKCMKDACNSNGECMAICDLLYFGAACSGTIAAACLYIAATN